MVELGISEFTFGYAFLYEQTRRNWGTLVAAPILPSLNQEAGEGWDARLPTFGCDFYYQFKLSDRLIWSNAKFIANGTYNRPYYRIKLYRRYNNRQHRMLWEHTLSNPDTYYVAPEFETIDDFNQAFLDNTITEHSRLIPLRECDNYPDYDSEQHYITYQANDPDFIQHSKSKRKKGSRSVKELQEMYHQSRHRWIRIDFRFANKIFEETKKMLYFLAEEERRKPDKRLEKAIHDLLEVEVPNDKVNLLSQTAKVLSVVFGVTMVIVGERQQKES